MGEAKGRNPHFISWEFIWFEDSSCTESPACWCRQSVSFVSSSSSWNPVRLYLARVGGDLFPSFPYSFFFFFAYEPKIFHSSVCCLPKPSSGLLHVWLFLPSASLPSFLSPPNFFCMARRHLYFNQSINFFNCTAPNHIKASQSIFAQSKSKKKK